MYGNFARAWIGATWLASIPAVRAALFAGCLRLLNYKKRGFPPTLGRVRRLAQETVAMRIQGTNAPTVAKATTPARRGPAASGFSVATEEPAQTTTAPAAALRTIGGIDALIALQSEEEPAGRRRRAVKRGRIALDALDELKHGLLAGTLGSSTLARLKSVATALKDASGEPGLDAVLAEIELRVEVEIAKLAPR